MSNKQSGTLRLKVLNSSGTTIPELSQASVEKLQAGSFVMKAKKKLQKGSLDFQKVGKTESMYLQSQQETTDMATSAVMFAAA